TPLRSVDFVTLSDPRSSVFHRSVLSASLFLTKFFSASKIRHPPKQMNTATVLQTSLSDLKLHRRGKVRDVYEVDDESLLIVATDRISAFDCILPTPIERKGEVLTAL